MLGGHIKQVKILTRQKTGIIIVDVMSLSHRKNIFRQLCALNWILEGMSQDQQPPIMPPITSCWKLKYVPCSIVFQLGVLCLFLSNGSCQFCFSWGLSVGFFVAIILKLIYYYNKINSRRFVTPTTASHRAKWCPRERGQKFYTDHVLLHRPG